MKDISPSPSVHLLPLFPSLVQQLRILLLYSPPLHQLRLLLLHLLDPLLGRCQPLLSLPARPITSHQTLMTPTLMMSPVLMILWVMGGRLVLQHVLLFLL